MAGDRTSQHLARIAAAAERLERAAAEIAQARQAGQDLTALRLRHERLRAAVGEGLQQLDALIEGAQG